MPPVIFAGGQAYTIQGQYAIPHPDVSWSPSHIFFFDRITTVVAKYFNVESRLQLTVVAFLFNLFF